ncbi:DnaJ domain-containing protein [Desulfovibrio sp. TomC]|uniref:DnaJ domain-containing protein n=1 Tax=Desulfovibrio sp. TomC TaxID=1562888 RepID=UPI000575B029|nr:DnaJ domain-containing protein [Desulfovibrio sp. TomC]KHK01848.1 hypothetical protein NY78_2667 [Desulfovibrio sp. TomC]
MPRHAQGQSGYGAKAGSGVADWQALEVQLTRTRVLLQEILVHLQEVLKNLRTARNGSTASAGRAEAAGARFTTARDSRFRSQPPPPPPPPGGADRFSRTQAQGAAGPSAGTFERNRFKARPHAEAKGPAAGASSAGSAQASAAGQQRPGAGQAAAGEDRTRASHTGSARPGQSTFRAHAGVHRERPRPESTFRARTAGPEADAGSRSTGQQRTTAGGSNGTAAGAAGRTGTTAGATGSARGASQQGQQAAGASRPHARPRPERAADGFRPDRDRQYRAREMARKNGMNLKCAYDILCLDYPCSVDEIKNAYRHMARMHHPDLGGDEEAMKDVNVAYELAMRFSAGRRTATAWAV